MSVQDKYECREEKAFEAHSGQDRILCKFSSGISVHNPSWFVRVSPWIRKVRSTSCSIKGSSSGKESNVEGHINRRRRRSIMSMMQTVAKLVSEWYAAVRSTEC